MIFFSTKTRILFFSLLLMIAAAAVGGAVYLNSSAFRHMILDRLNSALDGRITAGGHRLSIFSGRLVLTDLGISKDGETLMKAQRLEVRIDLTDLLRRTIHVSLLEMESVYLNLAFDGQDHLRMVGPAHDTRPPAESGPSAPSWQVIVDDYRLHNGNLLFRRPARGWEGRAEKVQLSGSLNLKQREGRLQLSAGPLAWRSEDLDRSLPGITLVADWNGDRISTITAETSQSKLNAKGRLDLNDGTPRLDVDADLTLALEEIGPWIPANISMEGRLAVRAQIRGGADDPRVELHVNLPQGNLAGFDIAPLNADLTLAQGNLSVADFKARGPWGALEAAGDVDITGKRIQKSNVTFTSKNLAELGKALAVELPAGSGTVRMTGQGPWDHPTARVEILAQDMRFRQYTIGRLLVAADLDASGKVAFSHLVLENQGSLVEGRGRLLLQEADGQWRKDPGLDLSFDIKNLDPENFGLAVPVKGKVQTTLTVGGTVRHIRAEARLSAKTLTWKQKAFALQGSARWDDGLLTLKDVLVSREAASARLQGDMRLRDKRSGRWLDSPLIDAELTTRAMELQMFLPDYKGAVTLDARVEGTPSDLNGSFKLTGSDLELAGQPLAAAVIEGRLAENTVHFERVDVTVALDQHLQGRGFYAFDQRFELSLDTAGIDLVNVPALQRAYPVEGLLVLDVKGHGTIQHPVMTGEMTIRQPRLQGRPWDDFKLQAGLQENKLDFTADLNFKVEGHGRLDTGDFQVTARLDDTDLSPYLAMAGGAQWGGRMSGRLAAGGNWRRPREIQADLDIAEGVLRFQSLDLLSIRSLRAGLRDGVVTLPASRMELMQDGYVNLSASGDVMKDIRMTADGRLPLAALAPFSDLLDGARGALVFNGRVTGALDNLQWDADANLDKIALEIPGLDQQVRDLNGRLRLNRHELAVENISGRMDDGRFSLDGGVKLKDLKPAGGKLVLTARSLPLQWPRIMDVVINGDLTLENAGGNSTLSGKVVFLEGTYYKDVRLNLLSAVSQPRRAEPVPITHELPLGLAEIGLNVSITHRYPLLVDNNLARLQVAPDLKLTGTLGRPVLSGRAQVTEGEVIFRSKSFTVKRGVVDFINPYKIEPSLDIAAEATIRQWQVSLSLSGTPDRLAFNLSSDPPESESDILSLILLGRTSEELAGGQGGGQTTRQMLATLVASAWGEDVKKTTGVDILEVETGTNESGEGDDSVQLTVGKRLSRRLTIKYEVESGSQQTVQRAVSEYRFLEHVLASGFQDSLGGYGGELLYRIEF